MPDTQAVEKIYVGVCEEVSEKNGWTAFHINIGTQWPVKLSTKLPALIEKGRAVGNQRATWHAKESQGGENPNKPGTYYTNRYFQDVVTGGEEADAAEAQIQHHGHDAVPTRSAQAVHQPLPIGDRERSIIRQTCLKAAGALFSGQGNKEVIDDNGRDTVSELIAAAARMETWIMRDIDDPPF